MKKIIFTLFIIITIAVAVLLGAKNTIAQRSLVKLIEKQTGFPTTIDSAKISPFQSSLEISGLVLTNPAEFNGDTAFQMKSLAVKYNTKSLFSDRIEIIQAIIDIDHINIVRNKEGVLNLQKLMETLTQNDQQASDKTASIQTSDTDSASSAEPATSRAAAAQPSKSLIIDELVLRFGTAEYTDYARNPNAPAIRTLKLDEERTYKNVTNAQDIVQQILTEILVHQGLNQIMDIATDRVKELGDLNIKDEDIKKAGKVLNSLFNNFRNK
ncbi:MAG: hypothetical protein EOL87_05570 [Spartobacteria bacterium]|nr:hypothetical protein [Spartobacteria bacterium]